jgi:hypothetical protein
MSNYRTWQSKQAFHRIMVLPFFAGSNFKLKTSLYSTKNFSFLDACKSMEEAHPTYAPMVVLYMSPAHLGPAYSLLKTSFTQSRTSHLDACTSMEQAHPTYAQIVL